LFASFKKTAGQSPAASGTKAVFQQQDLFLIVEDYGSGCDREAGVREAHAQAPHPHGE